MTGFKQGQEARSGGKQQPSAIKYQKDATDVHKIADLASCLKPPGEMILRFQLKWMICWTFSVFVKSQRTQQTSRKLWIDVLSDFTKD